MKPGSQQSAAWSTWLRATWTRLAPRERILVALATLVVGAGALWWVALQPAIKTLREAPATRSALEQQLQQVQLIEQQVKSIESLAPIAREEALRQIESSTKIRLGANSQVTVQGERVVVSVKSVTAEALADWLIQVRVNARAMPSQVQLRRTTAVAPALWEGSISLSLVVR